MEEIPIEDQGSGPHYHRYFYPSSFPGQGYVADSPTSPSYDYFSNRLMSMESIVVLLGSVTMGFRVLSCLSLISPNLMVLNPNSS